MRFARRCRDRFLLDLAPFWEPFWSHFRNFSETPGICDFCNPFNAKPLFLRVPAPPFGHFFGVFSGAGFRSSFFDVFCRFLVSLGLHLESLGPLFRHPFLRRFFDGFGVPWGGRLVTNGQRGTGSPGMRLVTFSLKVRFSCESGFDPGFLGFRCR